MQLEMMPASACIFQTARGQHCCRELFNAGGETLRVQRDEVGTMTPVPPGADEKRKEAEVEDATVVET